MAQDTTSQVLTPEKTIPNADKQYPTTSGQQAVQKSFQPCYPVWPTSTAGPRSTPPPPGSQPISAQRREQVAAIGSQQEADKPGSERKLTAQELLGKHKVRL